MLDEMTKQGLSPDQKVLGAVLKVGVMYVID